jgi:signal transduction histidine kinase
MSEPTSPDWLERANRLALTTLLLGTTVHEVNNALQVISGSAETLKAGSAPDDVIGRRGDAIGAHARRASALLAEISSFARDDSTQTAPLDLAQIGQRAVTMRQYSFARLKIESTFEARGESRVVVANPRLLLQLVLNLVVNAEQALEHRADGRVAIAVEGGAPDVTLTVDDNGPGVAADALPKLFVAAALASASHLGIGLAVSKHLAERFSGTLSYQPRDQGGSRFTLVLPQTRS